MVRIGPLSIGVLGLATIALLAPVAQGFTRAGGVEAARGAGSGLAQLFRDPAGTIIRAFGSATLDPTGIDQPPSLGCSKREAFRFCPEGTKSTVVGLTEFCCPEDSGPTRPPVTFEPPFDPNPHNCNRGRGEIWRPEFNACLNDQEFREFKAETEGQGPGSRETIINIEKFTTITTQPGASPTQVFLGRDTRSGQRLEPSTTFIPGVSSVPGQAFTGIEDALRRLSLDPSGFGTR